MVTNKDGYVYQLDKKTGNTLLLNGNRKVPVEDITSPSDKKNNGNTKSVATKEKAFLNSTWKMSPKEIERANKTYLKPINKGIYVFHDIIDKDRFTVLEGKNISLWRRNAKIQYKFFDNKLYAYYIGIENYYLSKLPDEIVDSLRGRFGTEKEAMLCNTPCVLIQLNRKEEDILMDITGKDLIIPEYDIIDISYKWNTESQSINLYYSNSEEQRYNVAINVEYLPFINQIKKISKKEKEKYF